MCFLFVFIIILSVTIILDCSLCLLLQVLELDVMDIRIVEERSYAAAIEMGSSTGVTHSAHTQRKNFLYFTDDKIFSVLMEICRALGM